ncbi:MAG: hypothetical protein LBN42_02135, partial [Oscillospiraceae bacterium]|nr:hypothetical protein [Oscillospiraceae bacterium]
FQAALDELKLARKIYAVFDFLLLTTAVVLCILSKNNDTQWKYFTGLALGNILSVAWFLSIGVGADIFLSKKFRNEGKARGFANAVYGVRYLGLMIVCCLILVLKLANIFFLVAPLFFIKIHFYIDALKKRPDKTITEFTGGKW